AAGDGVTMGATAAAHRERNPCRLGRTARSEADGEAIGHAGTCRHIDQLIAVVSAGMRHTQILLRAAVDPVVNVGPGCVIDVELHVAAGNGMPVAATAATVSSNSHAVAGARFIPGSIERAN